MLRKVLVASLAVAAISAHHWAKKSGYKKVGVNKLSTSCKKKGALYHCTVAAKVCGS
jgi:hypothetical protein